MAASGAIDAFGTLLSIGGTTIAEVQRISGPSFSRDARESTHMESPNNWREFLPGLKDGGEITMDIQFLPDTVSNHKAITDTWAVTTTSAIVLTFPITPADNWSFNGIVTGFEPDFDMEDNIRASVTIKVAGEITINAAV